MTEKHNTRKSPKMSILTRLLLVIIGFIVIVTVAFSLFVNTWQSSTYEQVHKMYPLEKSSNKEASEAFLKAMEYRIYIDQLHPFFDYDSVVMSPLLQKIDYYFQKGKALLPEDSVEDIVWWTLFYKEIHGLLGNAKNDTSLSFAELPYHEFIKVHDKVYDMIMRYPEGKVYFNIDEINKFRFKTMAILVGFYYKDFSYRYHDKTAAEREIRENRDTKAVELFRKVKEKYKVVYEKYINQSSDKFAMQRDYWSDIIYLSADLMAKHTFIHKHQRLSPSICNSDDAKFIVKHTDKLLEFVEENNNNQSQVINKLLFDRSYTSVPEIFRLLEYRCKNLHPEIKQIVQKVQELHKNKK